MGTSACLASFIMSCLWGFHRPFVTYKLNMFQNEATPFGLKKKNKKYSQLSCAGATCLASLQSLQLKNVHQGRKFYLYPEAQVERKVTGAGSCQDTGLSDVTLPWKRAFSQWPQKCQGYLFSINYLPDVRAAVRLITSFLLSPLKSLKCTGSTSSSLNSTR